ncbi:hypothetical protein WQ54_12005 [Bacillus sp. SA1-12]|uniref:hypothetical protein n=1 Tax=Bacillus sp. SA1-12 TaxID=1455638 RepID=UPI0006253260|nr:hypothetical protein [Bacillus sp. SA1-12]KKI92006.1 hypothetical protein WQ54_12005 [Bacillus sp. SA1-12]
MIKKLGCLHAHYSNVEYIETALSPYDIDLIHFVEPGLMHRVSSDKGFKKSDAQIKVKEQLEWIALCGVDAILITCTNYIALFNEDQLSLTIPIIKIDEPFFETIIKIQEPVTILFTNPATVNGTMGRLENVAKTSQTAQKIEVKVLNHSFDLLMQGLNEKYNQEIEDFLTQLLMEQKGVIAVAQLSMAEASVRVGKKANKIIINPLQTLVSYIVTTMKLQKKPKVTLR